MQGFLESSDYPAVFMVGVNGGQYSHRDYGKYKGHRAFWNFWIMLTAAIAPFGTGRTAPFWVTPLVRRRLPAIC